MKKLSDRTKGWLKCLAAAAVSGAGSGLAGVLIGIPFKKLLVLVGIHAAMSVGAYLQKRPFPDMDNPVEPVLPTP